MTITINPELEVRLKNRADAEGLTVSAYVERLVHADQTAEDELTSLSLEGLRSGDPIDIGSEYWQQKHRHLDELLKRTAGQ